MKFGVCYYPEHWPQERWAEDARLMREAGLDLVRLAEFAWSKMEPQPGRYEWDWLDEAIATLAGEGLQIILGTPTAAPPVWLTRQQPDILRQDSDGRYRDHGTRRHYCPNSPTYRHYSRTIVSAMAQRYGQDERVIGWQIDNEFGGGRTARCYCPRCTLAFQGWLRARYGQVEALNQAWGTIFWSQTYGDWSEIRPPHDGIDKPNPSHELDYYRFCSDSFVSYQQEQVELLRQLSPGRFITHNFMGLYRDLDQFDLAAPLDFVSWDAYPTGNPERWRKILYPPGSDFSRNDPVYAYDVGEPMIINMAHDLTRGLRQAPLWVMEQQCGHINWGDLNPGVRAGTPRLWSWQSVAAGADALIYFRWRATVLAQEQYHTGLLRHDGSPDVGWTDLARLQRERDLLDAVTAAPPAPTIALLFAYPDLWALEIQPHRADFHYLRHHFLFYQSLSRLGFMVDIVGPAADLSRYQLVIAPSLHLEQPESYERLQAYVQTGGALLLGVRSGFKTASNRVTMAPLPGALRPLTGTVVTDWQSLPPETGWPLQTDIAGLSGLASYWVERLRCETAVPLVDYTNGGAALTVNQLGHGQVYHLGWYPTPAQAQALLAYLTARHGLTPLVDDLPPGLFVSQRGHYLILINYTDQPLTARIRQEAVPVNSRDVTVIRV
jgi:beta-galactosidase